LYIFGPPVGDGGAEGLAALAIFLMASPFVFVLGATGIVLTILTTVALGKGFWWLLHTPLLPDKVSMLLILTFMTGGLCNADIHPGPVPMQGISKASDVLEVGLSEQTALVGMMEYLSASQDPQLGLLREAPQVAPNTYWLYTDNYLAFLTLRDLEPDVAMAIAAAIVRYEFEPLRRYHILAGEAVPQDLFTLGDVPHLLTIQQGKKVQTTIADPSIKIDWQKYADRILEAAMNAQNGGKTKQARQLFDKVRKMYDGVGIVDQIYREEGKYETYKLALYLIAADKLGVKLDERREILDTILSLQEADSSSARFGGTRTHYSSFGEPVPGCDTNTETTALSAWALAAILRSATSE